MSILLEQLEYGFDRDSRRTWRRRVLASGEDDAYGYDGLSQVINAAQGNLNLNTTAIGGVPANDETWDYDPTGNWRGYRVEEDGAVTLEQQRVHDKGNRLMQIEGSAQPVLVDRVGRMRQVPPDASGNWSEPLELIWDAWSRLVEVRQGGSTVGSYTYDGLSRRTTRTTGGVTWHCYYSDAWRPLEERRDSQSTAARQYYWGARHRDDLVRRDRATTSGGSLNETRYVLMDYFSPAALTDASGNVTERYAFSAFGVRRILAPDFGARSNSECDWEFGFQGQFLDSESGFHDYGYRYYSPHIGRWLSKDPIGEDGGVNLFAFAENCGVDSVDLLGLEPIVVPRAVPTTRSGNPPDFDTGGPNGMMTGFYYWLSSPPSQTPTPPSPSDPADWEDVIDPQGVIRRRRRLRWCLPCQPPVGTESYRHDKTPPEGNADTHYPCPASHVHWYIVFQRPAWIQEQRCKCEWIKNKQKPNTNDGVECVKCGWQGPPGISADGNNTPVTGGGIAP